MQNIKSNIPKDIIRPDGDKQLEQLENDLYRLKMDNNQNLNLVYTINNLIEQVAFVRAILQHKSRLPYQQIESEFKCIHRHDPQIEVIILEIQLVKESKDIDRSRTAYLSIKLLKKNHEK